MNTFVPAGMGIEGGSLGDFLLKSPTPYHASRSIADALDRAGFIRLEETDEWKIKLGESYYVTRNDTSIVAFRNGQNSPLNSGLRLIGAHLDSPCLKLNPNPFFQGHGYERINVEVYGSALVRTWFDRDLSIAGRVFYRDVKGKVRSQLVDLAKPVAYIPSIAIHLERDANINQEIDSQQHLNPICTSIGAGGESNIYELILEQLDEVDLKLGTCAIQGFDLSLYDINAPETSGASEDFITSARIDNLLSCHAGLQAIINAETENFCVLVCNDHEEVGSVSDSGAQSPFLTSVLERTTGLDPRIIRRSILVSADGAHGIHPNYPDKHDEQHAPVLNEGPVVKFNSNQRYATTGEMVTYMKSLCEPIGIPLQFFVSRNNIPCGSTVGPITASELGIKTVDIGVAQLAMHSIREIAGVHDTINFQRLLTAFLASDSAGITD